MPIFSDEERAYVRDVHPLGHLATLGPDGIPHVTVVGIYWLDDAESIVTSGHDLPETKKWRDVLATGRAALVIDDVLPPFRPRGIEVRGRAEAVAEPEPAIRIRPERIVTWGLDGDGTSRSSRTVRAATSPRSQRAIQPPST